MPNIYDLKQEGQVGEGGKILPGTKGPEITISSKQVPELEDYNAGERIELRVNANVVKRESPNMVSPDGSIKQESEPEIKITFEIVSVEVLNLKEDRKEANKRGLTKKDWQEIKGKSGLPLG